MRIAEEMAQEIYQVYTSGKNGVVLEMDHRQDWDPVIDCLQRQYFQRKVVLTMENGARPRGGKSDFLPLLYQRHLSRLKPGPQPARASLRALRDDELESAQPESYLALALRKYGSDPGVGMIVVEAFHLFPEEIRIQAVRALLQQLDGVKPYHADGTAKAGE